MRQNSGVRHGVALGVGMMLSLTSVQSHSQANPSAAAKAQPPEQVDILAGVDLVRVLSATELHAPGQQPKGPFAITSEGPLLVVDDNLYLPASSRTLLKKPEAGLSGFAQVPQGLVAIAGRWLGIVQGNAFDPKIRLPANMRLAVGGPDGMLYIYGGLEDELGRGVVYRYWPGGDYEKVVETSRPVRALVSAGGRIFFAADRDIYTYEDSEELVRIFRAGDGFAIDSLAYDPKSAIVYFSAGGAIWGLWGNRVTFVVGGISGELQWHEEHLFVLDAKTWDLYGLGSVSQAVQTLLARKPQPPQQ